MSAIPGGDRPMSAAAPARGRASAPAVRLGIVGCGRVTASLHVPALASVETIRIVALADTDRDALARVTALARPERTSPHYRSLVDDPSLDAIAVCVPAREHGEVALAAIDAGKHVFVEKPLALTLAECDTLAARAAAAGVLAMVGFNTRWHAHARRAREAIRRGEVGAIDAIASRFTSFHGAVAGWQRSRATGGGVFLDLAIHHVDLWRFLSGAEVDEVAAFARSGDREDEAATIAARLSDGTLATAVFAERTSRANDVDVWGRRGSIALSFYRFDGYATANAGSIAGDGQARVRAALSTALALPRALLDARRGGGWLMSYRDEWRHFAATIQDGVPVASTLDDGRRALAVVLAAIESATTGRSVKVARS